MKKGILLAITLLLVTGCTLFNSKEQNFENALDKLINAKSLTVMSSSEFDGTKTDLELKYDVENENSYVNMTMTNEETMEIEYYIMKHNDDITMYATTSMTDYYTKSYNMEEVEEGFIDFSEMAEDLKAYSSFEFIESKDSSDFYSIEVEEMLDYDPSKLIIEIKDGYIKSITVTDESGENTLKFSDYNKTVVELPAEAVNAREGNLMDHFGGPISDAMKGAAKITAYSYIDAVEKEIAINMLYDIAAPTEITDINFVTVKLAPTEVNLILKDGVVLGGNIVVDGYTFYVTETGELE